MQNRPSKEINQLIASGALGLAFSPDDVIRHLPTLTLPDINNALSRMTRAGILRRSGTRHNRTYQPADTSTTAVLGNLLIAMAEAEPALRKAIAIMKAIEQ